MSIWTDLKNYYFPPAKETPMTDTTALNASAVAPSDEELAKQIELAKHLGMKSQPSPLNDLRAEFAKAEAFIAHGIETLGADAEAELVALVKRYRR